MWQLRKYFMTKRWRIKIQSAEFFGKISNSRRKSMFQKTPAMRSQYN